MEPERTTTIGEGEFEITLRDFHNMNAVLSTRAKFRTWANDCRGFARAEERSENMFTLPAPGPVDSPKTGMKESHDAGRIVFMKIS